MIMAFLIRARNGYTVILLLLLVTKWGTISGTTILPTVSSQISQTASSFLSSTMVNKTINIDTIQPSVTSLIVHSTSHITLATTTATPTTQEADSEEDESKKRQVALICGACAGIVIVVVSITAVICTHSNIQVQNGG